MTNIPVKIYSVVFLNLKDLIPTPHTSHRIRMVRVRSDAMTAITNIIQLVTVTPSTLFSTYLRATVRTC